MGILGVENFGNSILIHKITINICLFAEGIVKKSSKFDKNFTERSNKQNFLKAMQIQRIQSVYILLAAIAMVIFMLMPYGVMVSVEDGSATSLCAIREYGVLIPAALTAVLLIIDIFLYHNISLQRTALSVSVMLTLATAAVVCFALFRHADTDGIAIHFALWDIMLPVALIFELLGVRGINRDIKLLRSYDRLR